MTEERDFPFYDGLDEKCGTLTISATGLLIPTVITAAHNIVQQTPALDNNLEAVISGFLGNLALHSTRLVGNKVMSGMNIDEKRGARLMMASQIAAYIGICALAFNLLSQDPGHPADQMKAKPIQPNKTEKTAPAYRPG